MKHPSFKSRRRPSAPAFTLALLAAGVLTSARAQVQTAGTLFVNVDATTLPEGTLNSITNTGTLGGVFAVTGDETTVPRIATAGGTKGIQMDGGDYLQHVVSPADLTLITTPEGLVGADPTQSIEVWALNPALDGEETLVSWGHRGGAPDGSNLAFNYGSDFRWGAVGHWGSPDMGWNNQGGGPAPNKWHHLVYTYDGTTTRVYADGVFQNGEFLGSGAIVTHPDTAIVLGAQTDNDAIAIFGGARLNGTIARVRVHDGVLTPEQILNNYNVEKAAFIDPAAPPPAAAITPERLTKAPAHRYSFNEPAGDATGKTFADSVSGADGSVLGDGATFSGTRLVLPGGSQDTAAYGDLPNGLLSTNGVANGGKGGFTFETWAKFTGSRTWSRVFDFGSSFAGDGNGELFAPGGTGNGQDYFMLSQNGDDVNLRRFEIRESDDVGDESALADIGTRTFNTDTHIVGTWDEASGQVTLYENGVRLGGFVADTKISDVNDVNNFLGRSQYTADQNAQIEYDEVRLYDYALTPGQVVGNFQAGPDNLNNADIPVTVVTQPQSANPDVNTDLTLRTSFAGSSPITVQWLRNGAEIPGATNAALSLTNVSAADNGAVFTARISNTANGSPVSVTTDPATVTVRVPNPVLKHQYSFNETGGTTVTDSVGGKNGTLVGGGAFASGELTLDGETGYVDLPNGLVTALGTNATFELWITQVVPSLWARIFDLGTSAEGEDLQGNGQDYLFLTSRTGDGFPRFVANFPDGGDITTLDPAPPGWLPGNQETHIVVTWSASGNTARLYINGVLVASGPALKPLSAMNNLDVNNWLGRSQFGADAYWGGKYDEFRIYNDSMTPAQVQASFAAGPNGGGNPNPGGDQPRINTTVTGGNLVLTWDAAAAGFVLEGSPKLGAGSTWTAVNGVTTVNGQLQATIPLQGSSQFFRLRKP